MPPLPVDQLLAPLSDDAPCGPDLEYDPAFMALEQAARGKPEQQFGDTVIAAEEPDWRAIYDEALALSGRTRDLRLAVLLARAGARQHGLPAYVSALSLIAGLLEQHWDRLYPLLDADDNNDPTMRLNALAPLVDAAGGLADLRAANASGGRLALTVRQIELASGKAEAHAGETAPSQEGMLQALRDAEGQSPGLLALLKQAPAEVARIEAVISDKVGAQGPEFKPLQLLTRWLANAAQEIEAGTAAAALASTEEAEGAPAGTAAAAIGGIRSRDDVARTLDRVCEWIERNEPSNPAPLLIRRAQRLMSKSFMDIIRDLAPDGISQVEKIAGSPD